MSGHNGIKKFAEGNRDGALLNYTYIGAVGSLFYGQTLTAAAPQTLVPGTILNGGLRFQGVAAGAYQFPTATAWRAALDASGKYVPGGCITFPLINETAADIEVDFGSGITTCDGSNTIRVAACSYANIQICETSPGVFTALGQSGVGASNAAIVNQNIGGGAELAGALVGPVGGIREFRTIESSDNSIGVTQTATTVDLTQTIASNSVSVIDLNNDILLPAQMWWPLTADYQTQSQIGTFLTSNAPDLSITDSKPTLHGIIVYARVVFRNNLPGNPALTYGIRILRNGVSRAMTMSPSNPQSIDTQVEVTLLQTGVNNPNTFTVEVYTSNSSMNPLEATAININVGADPLIDPNTVLRAFIL